VGQTAVDIDTLAQTLGGHITGLGVHQLILQGRAAGIDNQNVHWNVLLKIIFSFFAFCGMIPIDNTILYYCSKNNKSPQELFSKRREYFEDRWRNL
jgi:hypothetical protein